MSTATGLPITRVGLLPSHLRVQGGWLTSRMSGQHIPALEEREFFELIGRTYQEPWERQ